MRMSKATSEPVVHRAAVPYESRLKTRPLDQIERAVIHCTELPDLATARRYGERIHHPDSGTGNCGHFYIDRDGSIHQYVAPERIAHHVAGHNDDSVGIELVNLGRYPHWWRRDHQKMTEPYPRVQIDALLALLDDLKRRLPNLTRVAGHQDLDRRRIPATDAPEVMVPRKMDPGPLFPWGEVLARSGLVRS